MAPEGIWWKIYRMEYFLSLLWPDMLIMDWFIYPSNCVISLKHSSPLIYNKLSEYTCSRVQKRLSLSAVKLWNEVANAFLVLSLIKLSYFVKFWLSRLSYSVCHPPTARRARPRCWRGPHTWPPQPPPPPCAQHTATLFWTELYYLFFIYS